MVQTGKYQVGWRVYKTKDGITDIDTSNVAIYKDDKTVCLFTKDEAKEVTRLMISWCGLNCTNELTDKELMDALKERGYKGKLTFSKSFDL